MSTRARQSSVTQQHRQRLANAKKLAHVNPDALARNLLRWRKDLKSHQQRREFWRFLQNLGSDTVLKRAAETIKHTRSMDELEAVLRAAATDLWFEAAPMLAARFEREVKRIARRNAPEMASCLHAMTIAAVRLGARLKADDIRLLLAHRNARLRGVGVELVALQQREDLADDCLALCWDRGEASVFAGEAVGKLGDARHAAILWWRLLLARKCKHQNSFRRLLRILAGMGAFDVQLPLRIWLEEDVVEPGLSGWGFGKIWSQLVSAKWQAAACSREEAIADLRWFIRIAGVHSARGAQSAQPAQAVLPLPAGKKTPARRPHPPLEDEYGAFHVARQLALLGQAAEAEVLVAAAASGGLPPPDQFPELFFPGLSKHINSDLHGAGLAWKAAIGDKDAQAVLLRDWQSSLREGRCPVQWKIRACFDPEAVLHVLRESLQTNSPGALRGILGLLMGDKIAAVLAPELKKLASQHASAVVRWKARRVLHSMRTNPHNAAPTMDIIPVLRSASEQKQKHWVRLDAAVLSGAVRPANLLSHEGRNSAKTAGRQDAKKAAASGILPPERAALGYRLKLEGLSAVARRQTIQLLCKAALTQALERPLPSGPSLEERPDVKDALEPARPGNEIDQHMVEMALAVMAHWTDGEETLSLDEDGVAMLAAGLSSEIQLDEDDVSACGAFVGEALRKRLGGQWAGFDGHYRLEINDRVFDPIAWANEVYLRRDVIEGARILTEGYEFAVQQIEGPLKPHKFHPDPSEAFQYTMTGLYAMPLATPMIKLLTEARVLSYRLVPSEWPVVLSALDPLMEPGAGVRAVAALCVYAPGEIFARAWARWGRKLREESGLAGALIEAMQAAVERDDLSAMPDWTVQPQQGIFSFLNPLRKLMDAKVWRNVLLMLLRQRAAAGDRGGVGWCLYSYKYEFSDSLVLIKLFCDMSVSGRQAVISASCHATRDEQSLFRPLWAEALRDPAAAVVLAALDAANINHARSLRPLVSALAKDRRENVAVAAGNLLRIWQG